MTTDTSKQIRIGPIYFKVERVDKLLDDDNSTKLDGQVDYNKSIISIDSSLGGQKANQVVWHEIVHALLRQANAEGKDTETICDVLSYGIMQVLIDNELTNKYMEV